MKACLALLQIKDAKIGHYDLQLVDEVTPSSVLCQQTDRNPEHHPSVEGKERIRLLTT